MGESTTPRGKLRFDRRIRLEFHGATITSDAGLLARRPARYKPDELQVPAGSCQGLGRNESIVRVRAHSRGWSTRAVGPLSTLLTLPPYPNCVRVFGIGVKADARGLEPPVCRAGRLPASVTQAVEQYRCRSPVSGSLQILQVRPGRL